VTFRDIFRTDAKQIVNGANGAVKFLRRSESLAPARAVVRDW
jgi:hypothetical protein